MGRDEFTRLDTTIKDGEYHPAADGAMEWLKDFMLTNPTEYLKIKESLASTALSGNRLSELCVSTIYRLAKSKPVSDRYLLGLAWTVRQVYENGRIGKLNRQEDQAA